MLKIKTKTRRSGLSAGALRMPDTSEVTGISPPLGLLLLRFVNCEDSDLRLAGSDSYLAEVFPRHQCPNIAIGYTFSDFSVKHETLQPDITSTSSDVLSQTPANILRKQFTQI